MVYHSQNGRSAKARHELASGCEVGEKALSQIAENQSHDGHKTHG